MKHFFKTLIKLTACSAIAMYAVNKFIESSSAIWNLLKVNHGSYYNWRHGKVFYKKTGSGSPLLLLHDLNPTSSSLEWEKLVDEFSKEHTVYTIDLLGCGRSDKPNLTYSNFLYVQLISDFTKEIIKEKTDIAATGKSDSFVITAANLHPELFGTLFLVNPESFGTAMVCPCKQSKFAKALLYCPLLGTTLYYLLTRRDQIEYDFAENYFYNPFHISSKLKRAYYESAHLSGGRGRYLYGNLKGNYVNFDIRHALSSLKCPVYLLFGSKQENAQKIASGYQKINPAVQCRFIEKTKMLPQLEAPEQFMAAIKTCHTL